MPSSEPCACLAGVERGGGIVYVGMHWVVLEMLKLVCFDVFPLTSLCVDDAVQAFCSMEQWGANSDDSRHLRYAGKNCALQASGLRNVRKKWKAARSSLPFQYLPKLIPRSPTHVPHITITRFIVPVRHQITPYDKSLIHGCGNIGSTCT